VTDTVSSTEAPAAPEDARKTITLRFGQRADSLYEELLDTVPPSATLETAELADKDGVVLSFLTHE
jgi:hypothetical protein